MKKDFLTSTMKHFTYTHKEGTKTTYLSDNTLLPHRFSYSVEDMTRVQKKGRTLIEDKVGQLIGTYTKAESSPLKQYKPYVCRTAVFKSIDYPILIGYGTLGITGESGSVEGDNGDIIVLYSGDTSTTPATLEIFYFAGMNRPEYKNDVLAYVNNYIIYNKGRF